MIRLYCTVVSDPRRCWSLPSHHLYVTIVNTNVKHRTKPKTASFRNYWLYFTFYYFFSGFFIGRLPVPVVIGLVEGTGGCFFFGLLLLIADSSESCCCLRGGEEEASSPVDWTLGIHLERSIASTLHNNSIHAKHTPGWWWWWWYIAQRKAEMGHSSTLGDDVLLLKVPPMNTRKKP